MRTVPGKPALARKFSRAALLHVPHRLPFHPPASAFFFACPQPASTFRRYVPHVQVPQPHVLRPVQILERNSPHLAPLDQLHQPPAIPRSVVLHLNYRILRCGVEAHSRMRAVEADVVEHLAVVKAHTSAGWVGVWDPLDNMTAIRHTMVTLQSQGDPGFPRHSKPDPHAAKGCMIPAAEKSKEVGAEMVDTVQRDGGGARQRRDGVDAENPRGESPAGPVSEAERPGKTGALSWEDRAWIALDVCATAMLFGYSAWKCIGWRELVAKGGMMVGGLHRGWIGNLPQDLSDHQWRTLRGFFPLLAVGMVVHSLVSAGARRLAVRFPGRLLPSHPP